MSEQESGSGCIVGCFTVLLILFSIPLFIVICGIALAAIGVILPIGVIIFCICWIVYGTVNLLDMLAQ